MKKDKNHSFEETDNQNVEVINLTEIYDDESEDSFLQDDEESEEAVDEDIIIEDNTEDDSDMDNLPDDEEAEIVVDDLDEAIEEDIDIQEDIEDDDDQIITLSNIYKEVSNVYKEADVDKEIDKETNQEVAKKEDAIIIKFENNSLSIDEEKIEKILYDVVKKHFFENVADKMEKIIEKTLLDEIEKMEKILTEIKLS